MLGLGASALFLLGSSFQLTVEMFDYLECELNLFQTGESFPPISPGFHGQCLVPSLFATWTSHASPYTLQSTGSGTWRLQALRPSFSSGAFAVSDFMPEQKDHTPQLTGFTPEVQEPKVWDYGPSLAGPWPAPSATQPGWHWGSISVRRAAVC